MEDKHITPIVVGAFSFIVAHVAQQGVPVAGGVAAAAAVGTYVAVTKPWASKTKEAIEFEDDDDEEDFPKQTVKKSKKSKKKKKNACGTQKKNKRSSYEDDVAAVEEPKKEPEDDGLTKSQRRRQAKKESKKKAAKEAKKGGKSQGKKGDEPAVKKLSKKQRQKLRRKEKEALEAAKEEEQRMMNDGWEMTESAKKRQAQDMAKKKQALLATNEEGEEGDAAESTEMYVDIPMDKHGKIVGPKGSIIRQIREETGVEIKMPKQGGISSFITLIGPSAGCKAAKAAIVQLASEGICSITHKGFVTLKMPVKRIGLIIGPGGSNVKALQAGCNVKINLPKRDSEDKDLTIVGPAENVEQCKEAILELVSQEFCRFTHPGWVRGEVPFLLDRSTLPELLGRSGENVNRIQKSTKTKIKIPNSSSINQNIIISGEAGDVEKAKTQVREILARIQAGPVIHPDWQLNENYNPDDDWS